ncbi:MAG: 2-oxoacid:acceptor oxidoreductase family protein [candidate division Zixibacteria bacterium]|nr:2-oxoacid:acceptor oxidoreductase family protein [candidate division Zixibacteria bacterium]
MKTRRMDAEHEDRYDMRLSGSGGQGLVFAGTILSEALGIYEGKNISQTQSYGPEARGGASRSDIVFSSGDIYYPKALKLDLLLALTQEACDTYCLNLKDESILLVDSDLVDQPPAREVISLPFTRTARENLGTPVVANIIALGAIVSLTKIVSKESIIEAIKGKSPKAMLDLNLRAAELGFDLARKEKRSRKKPQAARV